MPSKDESAVAVFDATSAEPPIAAASEASVAHPAGLGVDILEIERLQKAFQRLPVMRERLFSAAEIAYAESKARPIVHYALFFAAKEAVLKALGTGFRGMRATDVEVCHTASGRPYPVLRGAALAEAERQAVLAIELSLSYTHQVAVASAVAIRGEDQPRRPESSDPKAELLRQFKALRSLLDDLESELVPASSAVEPVGIAASPAVEPAATTASTAELSLKSTPGDALADPGEPEHAITTYSS